MVKMLKWFAVTGVAMMIAANVIAALTGGFSMPTFLLAGLGLILFLSILFLGETPDVAGYLRSFLNVFFLVGTFVFLYLIVENHNIRRDFTRGRLFSLSRQSIHYLKGLDEPVKVTGFSTAPQQMRRFFEQYTRHTDQLKIEMRNPFKDFREASLLRNEFGGELYPGDVFIQCGKRRKRIRELDENTFINALVEVRREEETVVYFLTGHGEGTLEQPTEEQLRRNVATYHSLKRVAEKRGMKVQTLELMRTGVVPDDASVLVCAGPSQDLYPVEKDALEAWLNQGGRLILMLDPPTTLQQTFPRFKELMQNFGVALQDNIIMDANKASMEKFGLPVVPLVTEYLKHPVTDEIPHQGTAMFVPVARTVLPNDNLPPTVNVSPLLKTSPSSWSQSMEALLEEDYVPPDKDSLSPQTLAVAVKKTPPGADEDDQARIVVFGDSDIFTDVNIVYQIPIYLFLNSISWLTQTSDVVAIPPKVVQDTPMTLTAAQKELLAVLLVITFPSLVFFGGLGYTLIRRRVR